MYENVDFSEYPVNCGKAAEHSELGFGNRLYVDNTTLR